MKEYERVGMLHADKRKFGFESLSINEEKAGTKQTSWKTRDISGSPDPLIELTTHVRARAIRANPNPD